MGGVVAHLFLYRSINDISKIVSGKKSAFPVFVAFILFIFLIMIPTGFEGGLTYRNADRVKAEVLSTDESAIMDTGLIRTGEQRCHIRVLDGMFKGQEADAVNRLNGSLAQDKIFAAGDYAFVAISYREDRITAITMIDHYRIDKEMLLAGLFVILLVVFAGKTGIRAILSFAVTILIMWKIMIPCLLRGFNPVWLSLGIVAILTFLILSLIYGWDQRCLASFSGALGGNYCHNNPWKHFYRFFSDSWRCHGI